MRAVPEDPQIEDVPRTQCYYVHGRAAQNGDQSS